MGSGQHCCCFVREHGMSARRRQRGLRQHGNDRSAWLDPNERRSRSGPWPDCDRGSCVSVRISFPGRPACYTSSSRHAIMRSRCSYSAGDNVEKELPALSPAHVTGLGTG
jgi:hypothetical protein